MTSQLKAKMVQVRRRIQFDCSASLIGGFRETFGDTKHKCIAGRGITRERIDLYGPACPFECLVEAALH